MLTQPWKGVYGRFAVLFGVGLASFKPCKGYVGLELQLYVVVWDVCSPRRWYLVFVTCLIAVGSINSTHSLLWWCVEKLISKPLVRS